SSYALFSALTLPISWRGGPACPRHVRPENSVHASLVARSRLLEPVENVLIDPQRDRLLRGRHHKLALVPKIRREVGEFGWHRPDRKSTRLNSSHVKISYAVFCLKKKNSK